MIGESIGTTITGGARVTPTKQKKDRNPINQNVKRKALLKGTYARSVRGMQLKVTHEERAGNGMSHEKGASE